MNKHESKTAIQKARKEKEKKKHVSEQTHERCTEQPLEKQKKGKKTKNGTKVKTQSYLEGKEHKNSINNVNEDIRHTVQRALNAVGR